MTQAEVKTLDTKELKEMTKLELAQIAIQGQEPEAALEMFYAECGLTPAAHINVVTKKEYTNGNVWALELAMILGGFASCEWATFNQFSGAGRSIIKGSKSSKICVAVFGRGKKQSENEQNGEDKKEELKFFKGGSVFNIEQTEESEFKKVATPKQAKDLIQKANDITKEIFKGYAVVA